MRGKTFWRCVIVKNPVFRYLSFLLLFGQLANAQPTPPVDPATIEIVRDQWGVPHIYAKTDAGVCYGLAWAHCEDDFSTIQEALLIARGEWGKIQGKNGAIFDFLFHFCRIPQRARAEYDSLVSPKGKRLLEAYAAAVNAYARTHPKQVIRKDIFPVSPVDIVQGYMFTGMLFTSFPFALQFGLMDRLEEYHPGYYLLGSNAIALNPQRTADGKTYLAVNSHQPLQGVFSWYEAHLVSDEGLNILGGVFPGGISIFHGTTPTHGWAATLNAPDLVDYYRLEMHPKKRLTYRYNGQWRKLKKRRIKLKVKLGPIILPVGRTVYESVWGPTIESEEGEFYSFDLSFMPRADMPEQFFAMNKAKNLEEWKQTFERMALPSVNFIYADKDHNIAFIHNARTPKRRPGINWELPLPGDTSLWAVGEEFVTPEEMVRWENPACGFLFNTNNSPLLASCPQLNRPETAYDTTFGLQLYHNNRSRRLQNLLSADEAVSWEEFKTIKYDYSFPQQNRGPFLASIDELFAFPADTFPKKLRPLFRQMRKFDGVADTADRSAAALLFTIYPYFYATNGGSWEFETGIDWDFEELLKAMQQAEKLLRKNYGRYDPTLGQVQRLERGKVSLAIYGMPDVLAAINSRVDKKRGRLIAESGESYIQLVRYNDDGVEYLGTVHAYGSSARPDSPHFTDQMELFVKQQLKPMTFDEATIRRNAERIYHPGE